MNAEEGLLNWQTRLHHLLWLYPRVMEILDRICADFKVKINQWVEAKIYPLPMVEDIFVWLAGGKVFTKLCLSQAYLQLAVDEDSKGPLVRAATNIWFIQDSFVKSLSGY